MRAIKTTTISVLAISLLAGSAVGVAAQDEATEGASAAGSDAMRLAISTAGVAFTLPDDGWSAEAYEEAGFFQPIAQLADPSAGSCLLLDHAGTAYDANWGEVWDEVEGNYWLRREPGAAVLDKFRDDEVPGIDDYAFERLWLPGGNALRLAYVEPSPDGYKNRMVEYWLVADEGTVQLECAAGNAMEAAPMSEADLADAEADFAAIAESIEFLPVE